MLCRALLAAVALSYVLCVLLLSGVQKEDIDASTLRKLQRHNVNIDDIDARQLRKQCLVKTNMPVTALTQENPVTEKAVTEKSVTAKELSIENEKVGSQVEDRSKLRKIFEFLEYNRRAEKRNALKSKHNTPALRQEPNSKLRANSSFRRNINVEDTSTEKSELRRIPIAKEDDEKTNKANVNKKLDNFMNIWEMDIGRITKTTHQESTTVKVIKANIISKNTKYVEYITKIVEGILSKKELNDLMSAHTENKPTYYNSNATVREADQISSAKSKNNTVAATNYALNNCNLGNFNGNNQDDLDKYERLDNYQRLSNGIKVPATNSNDNNVLCKRVEAKEKKILTDRIHNDVVHNILNKLNQEIQSLKPSDKESAIRTLFENQLKSADYNQDTTSNLHRKRLNTLDSEIITPVKNQSESITSNRQGDRMKTWDTYIDGFDLLDVETAGALEAALKTQSNIYNQIFNRQRDLLQMSNTDKERIKQLENARRKELQSALIAHPSTFSYKPSEQDGDLENKGRNIWRSAYLNTLNNQKQTTEPRENMVINNVPYIQQEKSTNTLNTMEYELKRPWFYSGGQLRTKNKEKLKGVFFKPIDDKKITNTEPRQKYSIGKKWSPYFDMFDKNSSIIETDEIETPKVQKTILGDSYKLVQLNNKEISQELTENNKKHSNFDILYQNKNESPNIMKERSSEQFETTKDKKLSQSNCQTIYETRRECLPDAEYKSNWAYFRNKKIEKQRTNMKENSKESNFNYQFPSKPRTTKSSYGKYITEDELDTKNSNKLPAFPQNVIKDIANSIKEIVLKDLLTTTIIPIMTIKSKTSSSPTTTTTTTTPKTTISTSTMTTTTIKPTEGTSTADTKQQLKIQDASKAMEKIMEMLEKINSFKDKIEKHESVTYGNYRENVRYDTKKIEATTQTIINRQLDQDHPAQQKTENDLAYDPQSLQPNLEKQTPYVSQTFQPNTENREPYPQKHLQYIPQTVQMKHENVTSYVLPALQLRAANRLPYVPQPIQGNSDSRYFPPVVENRLPYPQNLQSNLENRNPYVPLALQMKTQNRIPYVSQTVQTKTDNRTPYVPQPVQIKPEKENGLPYNPQNLQSNTENPTPYFPQSFQMKSENRERSPENHGSYEQQHPVQSNIGNHVPYDPQPSQSNPDNSESYLPQPLQYAPNVQKKTENRVPYDPQPSQSNPGNSVSYLPQPLQYAPNVQKKTENRVPYDPQPSQSNPGNSVSYLPQPLQYAPNVQKKTENRVPYDPQPSQSNPDNSVSYLPQPLQYAPNIQQKTENRVPYDPQPLQRNPVFQYGVKNPYYNSKIELDPYQDKEVLEPIKQKVKPRKYAITLQTNSDEIAPLKIAVRKPVLQTIVLTTKSPTKLQQNSEEIFNGRKPKSISQRHNQPKESGYQDEKPKDGAYQDDKPKETDIRNNGENKQYFTRHTHRDGYIDHPKSRKIKEDREANHQFKPRDRHGIERFHERLERGEVWPQYEEKIAKRVQRPIVKNNYDDTHFRNFLQTQQKVNAMLERILATSKGKPMSTEVV